MDSKPKSWKHVARAGSICLMIFAGTAGANSSTYSFTMDRYYADGKKNEVTHNLTAGDLTITGKIWIYKKLVSAFAHPFQVTLVVLKSGTFFKQEICRQTWAPSTTESTFLTRCGHIDGGTYWIEVAKENDDGNLLRCEGALTTQ